jgi:hypothetical protein
VVGGAVVGAGEGAGAVGEPPEAKVE